MTKFEIIREADIKKFKSKVKRFLRNDMVVVDKIEFRQCADGCYAAFILYR